MRDMPEGPRRHPLPTLAWSLGLCLGLAACGRSTPEVHPGDVSNLLARTAHIEVHTDQELTPTKLKQWGSHSDGGWRIETEGTGLLGNPAVRTFKGRASLRLSSTGPRERELVLEVRATEDATGARFLLNGAEIGAEVLSDSFEEVHLTPPPSLWLRGQNRLTLELEGTPPDGTELVLASVAVSPAAGVWQDEAGVTLDPSTAASFGFELAAGGILDCTLSSDADPGPKARLSLLSMDPLTGERHSLEERELAVEAGKPSPVRLSVPDVGGSAFELRIAWEAAYDSPPLKLERLELFESRPLVRPPILFLSIDTLAAQNMSLYGYGRATTPRLEELAKDSVVFELARSNAPWTLPSYVSQFTGQFAHANRNPHVDDVPEALRTGVTFYRIPPSRRSLPELLSASGYRTSAIVDNLWLAQTPGFERGFESFDPEPALAGHGGLNDGMRMVLPRALEQLFARAERPPFVFAQILDVHGPYLPRTPFKGHFSSTLETASLPKLPIVRGNPGMFGGIPDDIALGRFETRDELPTAMPPALLQADYDGKVLELDATLGDFFEQLKSEGLYDELLIIFSADHGESMVDHEFNFHHGIVYDSAIHVPLLFKLPHSEHAGLRVEDPVQLVDLYPTLRELIGLAPEQQGLQGRSLLPLIEGQDVEPAPLFAQGDVMRMTSLSLGKWKLIGGLPGGAQLDVIMSHPTIRRRLQEDHEQLLTEAFGPAGIPASRELPAALDDLKGSKPKVYAKLSFTVYRGAPLLELYDTEADPGETRDLAASHPELVGQLAPILLRLRSETQALQDLAEDSTPAPSFSPEMLDELKRLGYLGDE